MVMRKKLIFDIVEYSCCWAKKETEGVSKLKVLKSGLPLQREPVLCHWHYLARVDKSIVSVEGKNCFHQ